MNLLIGLIATGVAITAGYFVAKRLFGREVTVKKSSTTGRTKEEPNLKVDNTTIEKREGVVAEKPQTGRTKRVQFTTPTQELEEDEGFLIIKNKTNEIHEEDFVFVEGSKQDLSKLTPYNLEAFAVKNKGNDRAWKIAYNQLIQALSSEDAAEVKNAQETLKTMYLDYHQKGQYSCVPKFIAGKIISLLKKRFPDPDKDVIIWNISIDNKASLRGDDVYLYFYRLGPSHSKHDSK